MLKVIPAQEVPFDIVDSLRGLDEYINDILAKVTKEHREDPSSEPLHLLNKYLQSKLGAIDALGATTIFHHNQGGDVEGPSSSSHSSHATIGEAPQDSSSLFNDIASTLATIEGKGLRDHDAEIVKPLSLSLSTPPVIAPLIVTPSAAQPSDDNIARGGTTGHRIPLGRSSLLFSNKNFDFF